MTYTVIIPARYGSSRLPGKPLLDIAGKPMVQHVYERACQSSANRVLVATDDDRIAQAVKGFGGEVCMTLASHESGTDRLQEVVAKLGLADDEVVVNVQGDEPLIPPAVINQVAANLSADPAFAIATLVERITETGPLFDPNAVKVALGNKGNALYFSRATIPWHRDHFASEKTLPPEQHYWRHIGIYAYRVGFLHNFVTWPAGQLEQVEKLEQLRALENGAHIHAAAAAEVIPAGVDTQADLETVRQWFVDNGAA